MHKNRVDVRGICVKVEQEDTRTQRRCDLKSVVLLQKLRSHPWTISSVFSPRSGTLTGAPQWCISVTLSEHVEHGVSLVRTHTHATRKYMILKVRVDPYYWPAVCNTCNNWQSTPINFLCSFLLTLVNSFYYFIISKIHFPVYLYNSRSNSFIITDNYLILRGIM